MKITYKFILKTYVGPMILTFFIVMFILLMHFMWMQIDNLVGKGLSMGVIAELIMYALATFMPMGLPLATLLASIMTLGNLGEYNELLALKAAGVSLPRIMKPLIILMVFVCGGSFFVINNLTPYCYNQMFLLLSDISRQNQEIEFQDGIFFNGFPDMSVRVSRQDPQTGLLTDVLIYNNKDMAKMQTIVADSGYISLSPDNKFIIVDLYKGQLYEQTRNYDWYSNNVLSHHFFDHQITLLPISGYSFERSDFNSFKGNSETLNMNELSYQIDSLEHVQDSIVNKFTNTFMLTHVFKKYEKFKSMDSINYPSSEYVVHMLDTMDVTARNIVFTNAKRAAEDASGYLNYEIEWVRYTSNQLFRAQESYQKKLALPFSIMIFFLIGAPLGAIIRKGGLGMPIVTSVSFFIIYYIISILGQNFVRDGSLPAYIGVWLSSIVLLPIAIFLTYKSTNDSALFNSDAYITKIKRVVTFFKKIKK